MTNTPRVAFYVRNGFQISHLRPLFRSIPGAAWVVKSRKHILDLGLSDERVVVSRLLLRRTLNSFDAVVSHAGPPGGRVLRHAKWIMVQYGYAKEPYNFGDWRKQADAILAYGDYAVDRFAVHAPAYAVGNPRWDDWQSRVFREEAVRHFPQFPTGRPVVLYAPTWGSLSSLPVWSEAVADLATTHTVLIRAHHNAAREGQLQFVQASEHVHDVSDVDLMVCLSVANVLVSDYSGAIFDGIMCDLPVVLLDLADIAQRFGDKLDAASIEIARRDELGVRVSEPAQLSDAMSEALAGATVSDDLKAQLFHQPVAVADAFRAALDQVIAAD